AGRTDRRCPRSRTWVRPATSCGAVRPEPEERLGDQVKSIVEYVHRLDVVLRRVEDGAQLVGRAHVLAAVVIEQQALYGIGDLERRVDNDDRTPHDPAERRQQEDDRLGIEMV